MGHILNSVTTSGLSTDEIDSLIDKWVFGSRNRKILKLKLIHGLTYKEIADKANLAEDTIKDIVRKGVCQLTLHF
jgi:DNA-binding NarL/FixJ family response regulator